MKRKSVTFTVMDVAYENYTYQPGTDRLTGVAGPDPTNFTFDANGNIIPWSDDITINFEISGTGKLAGVGNGNPADMSSFQQPRKKVFHGICLAIIRPETTPGKISIRAAAEGLKDASLVITTK